MTNPDMKGFWDQHYRDGRGSGSGSVGVIRAWKWSIINECVLGGGHILDDVIDVGCGDLVFWRDTFPAKYTGIDISEYQIEKNMLHPNYKQYMKFICAPAEIYISMDKSPVVLCMDVLQHILDDSAFKLIIYNLTQYSSKWIFIHAWTKNPWKHQVTDGVYQTYRNFNDYTDIIENEGFKLINRYSSDLGEHWVSTLFVFRKEELI